MRAPLLAVLAAAAALAPAAGAEPMFLSRQYARCTTCHFSAAGGGLLTPYGRMLSRQELSTTGATESGEPKGREHEFLFGLFKDGLGEFSAGISVRPAHLRVEAGDFSTTRDFVMIADLMLAWRHGPWTVYGEFGRQARGDDDKIDSFEHWVSYKADGGFGVRAGRFLPAYGVRFADHTSFNRAALGFDNDDQVYALEFSHASDKRLFQLSLGPGDAESLVDDQGLHAFTATGRAQFDLTPRTVLVASGLYRAEADRLPSESALGAAVGFAPTPRVSLWGQGDVRFRDGADGEAWVFAAEAGFELHRGVWLKAMPQLRTQFGDFGAGTLRLGAGLELLPRSHFNLILNYYHDRFRGQDASADTVLAQLHLYL